MNIARHQSARIAGLVLLAALALATPARAQSTASKDAPSPGQQTFASPEEARAVAIAPSSRVSIATAFNASLLGRRTVFASGSRSSGARTT